MGSLISETALKSGEWKLADKGEKADVIIDFSAPAGTEESVAFAQEHKIPIVIGTTGLNEEQKKEMGEAAKKIAIVFSPNMSVGVNVLFKLIEAAAKTLQEGYAVEINETHHTHKKDRPSGTAKMMGEIVEKIRHQKPPITSFREGEVIGDHTIIFSNESEHLALLHRALDRKVFAQGALRAAKWVLGKKAGLYNMSHVLGLKCE